MARPRLSSNAQPSSFATTGGHGEEIWRTFTNKSERQREREREEFDSGDLGEKPFVSKVDDWSLSPEVRSYQLDNEKSGLKGRRLGVTWQNLSVKGVAADAALHENVFSQFNILQKVMESHQKSPMKTILHNSHGCVKPGEMLLVLGRPGAGCTTLLKMLSNRRSGYAEVSGDVHFGSLDYKQAKRYKSQIVMNTEDELFYPTLTVGQTMEFATRMKIPFHLPSNSSPKDFQKSSKDFLLRSMGISHTNDTKVGNEYVRGVSGGERKRVSIIECMATRGSVFCWDNSTRGLDASTALEWTKAIRAMTDILGITSIATLYQAGNGIYNLFDKILVLDEGREIFYGSREQARPFMEDLGFLCDDSANVGDFLTGLTVPTERTIKSGYEHRFPRTAAAVEEIYNNSNIKTQWAEEYKFPQTKTANEDTAEFKEAVAYEKHKSLPEKSSLTTSFPMQVATCVIRQYQIIWGDKASFIIKQGATLLQALVVGSLFYQAADNSGGLFVKGGALFFALLFNTLMAMSEVTDSFTGRPVLAKHKEFALYHPAAFCIAQMAVDVPVLLIQVSHFAVVLYFMVGLKISAAAFFTFWFVVLTSTFVMTACFRLIGAAFSNFDDASKVSGILTGALIMYCGYLIPKTSMHPWFVWIYWIDPLAYGFEALMGNELGGQIIPCVGKNLIPNGPSYTNNAYQSCAGVSGAVQGATSLTGEEYLKALSYSASHVWRNIGILWAWWALFVGLTIFFTCRWKSISENSGFLLIPRELKKQNKALLNIDEESQVKEAGSSAGSSVDQHTGTEEKSSDSANLVRNTSVFTWKDLSYVVKTPSGDRTLLSNVNGWVKPGMLGALMGSSGAGKTTLLDVLAQRKTEGTIKGSIMVDGRPLTVSFQRSAGYCEQLDVHEPYTTVREALEFSAILRQSRNTPRSDKLNYVDTIVDLLELRDIENTLIGTIGSGLSVEQRKRVTIGVELVSKPSILIFLDEPTSGLDGQSAFNTLRFLKKLASAGQAVLCTVHQPSAQLFQQFDTLLLLQKDGRTSYFGKIGEDANTLKEYFGRYDRPCPPGVNPAEHMIDVVSGSTPDAKDWAQVWLESPEHGKIVAELDHIIAHAAAAEPGTKDDGHEFAMPLWEQTKIVTQRMNVTLYRNIEYVNNKLALHVGSALFNGFTFWQIGDSVSGLQLALFTIFNFIFVAPGVINQLQPLFIARRDIYEAREKKSKMYSWVAFVTGLIVSELPYLCVCAVLYFVCWYYTVGFPTDPKKAGAVFFVMLTYEFVYTGIGQFVAAYAPNAVSASLANPLIIGVLVSFCGVLVPYGQITTFWRYWIYYLNPFTYLMGSLLTFTLFSREVHCTDREFALFDTPDGQTCASYLAEYLAADTGANLVNPNATSGCRVCQYTYGSDYLVGVNINNYYDGWRDAAIVVIFAISSYAMVYGLMKLRTKASKKAE